MLQTVGVIFAGASVIIFCHSAGSLHAVRPPPNNAVDATAELSFKNSRLCILTSDLQIFAARANPEV
jgi:hypothetical protein